MDIFNALSVPSRRKIMEILAQDGQMPATAISHRFRITPPAISQHLKTLRQAGLVTMQKNGQQRLYSINPNKMQELEKWAAHLARQWNERFDRLDKLLAEEKERILKNFDINAASGGKK